MCARVKRGNKNISHVFTTRLAEKFCKVENLVNAISFMVFSVIKIQHELLCMDFFFSCYIHCETWIFLFSAFTTMAAPETIVSHPNVMDVWMRGYLCLCLWIYSYKTSMFTTTKITNDQDWYQMNLVYSCPYLVILWYGRLRFWPILPISLNLISQAPEKSI